MKRSGLLGMAILAVLAVARPAEAQAAPSPKPPGGIMLAREFFTMPLPGMYVLGILDGIQLVPMFTGGQPVAGADILGACTGKQPLAKTVEVVKQYLEAHPDKGGYALNGQVLAAIIDDCRNRGEWHQ